MKNTKSIITLWILALACLAVMVMEACSNLIKHNNEYVFNTAMYDSIPDLTTDSLESLFNQGITAKHFEGKNYFIINQTDKNITDTCIDAIDWGPLTIDRKINEDRNKFYKLEFEDQADNAVQVKVTINLISKFNGCITKVKYKSSWVSWTPNNGYGSVFTIPDVVTYYPTGLNEGGVTRLVLIWEADKNLVKGNPLLVSSEVECFYNDNKTFKEIMTFQIDNYLK